MKENIFEGTIKVKVLDPIETVGLKSEEVSELTTSVRDKMQIVFNQISHKPVSIDSYKKK
jgi:hypothetical protein